MSAGASRQILKAVGVAEFAGRVGGFRQELAEQPRGEQNVMRCKSRGNSEGKARLPKKVSGRGQGKQPANEVGERTT